MTLNWKPNPRLKGSVWELQHGNMYCRVTRKGHLSHRHTDFMLLVNGDHIDDFETPCIAMSYVERMIRIADEKRIPVNQR